MSEIIEDFFDKVFIKYNLTLKEFIDIFERPDFDLKVNEVKQEIKAFHIFDDINGYNALFITSDDKVFGFGSNCFGCCGLGHNSVVNEPQIIPELCHKNIQQFFIGYDFILAQNSENLLHSWGNNYWGQLGIGITNDESVYLKPGIITSKGAVIEVSCGTSHCLALCSDGFVYGWGDNRYGQTGCGVDQCVILPKLTWLKNLFQYTIKKIYCSFNQSFALTNGGLVYSWGYNECCVLGHDFNRNGSVSQPRIIKINNIRSICSSITNTYFLNGDGELYFCGFFKEENNCESIQTEPKKIHTESINSIYSTIIYHKRQVLTNATTRKNSLILFGNNVVRNASKFCDKLYHFHFNTQMNIHKTINMCKYLHKSINIDHNKISDFDEQNKIDEDKANIFNGNHEIIVSFFDRIFEKYSFTFKEFFANFERSEFDEKVNEIRNEIKAFHIFDDVRGYNVFLITSDDQILGFGSNCFGCCGLGHNSVVNEPQIIPKLCHKNIKQFFIGYDFILAQSFENKLYGWGKNNCGQLGIRYMSEDTEYLKPKIIKSNKLFNQISCGSKHSLALCSDGFVYGWGDNVHGQVGCGKDKGHIKSKVIRLERFTENSVKNIYCSFNKSFALTFEGLVYSWGSNHKCSLGHELNKNECVFEPKLINISNIISIGFSIDKTLFLTNEGKILFCGRYFDENNGSSYQKSPKLDQLNRECHQICFIPVYRKMQSMGEAFKKINLNEKDGKTIHQFFYGNYKMTYNTLVMDIKISQTLCESKINREDNNHEKGKIFRIRFAELDKLHHGGFGSVFKMKDLNTQNIFAIKQFKLEGN